MGTTSAADVSQVLWNQDFPHLRAGRCTPPRNRLPRTTIELTEEQRRTLGKNEIQKLKNRVAAQRARERAQQRTTDLEVMVKELWNRVQYLEGVIQKTTPGQSLDDLYNDYVPYMESSILEPLEPLEPLEFMGLVNSLEPLSKDPYLYNQYQCTVDMEQLDWLLN